VTDLWHQLLLGLVVLVASALPFVPTGEIVSGAAALAAASTPAVVALFFLAWICSWAGDTLLLLEVRLLARPLQSWLDRRASHPKVLQAQERLERNAFVAVVTARLVPGMRAFVILALGLVGTSLRRFVVADLVGCGIWAAAYTAAGAIGGRLTTHPVVAVVVAILLALLVSGLGGLLVRRRRTRTRLTEELGPEPVSSDQPEHWCRSL
jgi:membrane protein DedA with SNARE-associated domain